MLQEQQGLRNAESKINTAKLNMCQKEKIWSTSVLTSSAPVEALQLLFPLASGYMLFHGRQLCRVKNKSWGENLTY